MNQEAYNNVEEFYVNYAGGKVDDAPFDKKYPTLPKDMQEKLQARILEDFGVSNPTMHASWITINKLGPIFMYRTQSGTKSKLYPGMNVIIGDDTYTAGSAKNVQNQDINYFTFGKNGADLSFLNKVPYSTSNGEQVSKCNEVLQKMIEYTTDNTTDTSLTATTQVIYAETPIQGNTFPKIVATENDKIFAVTSLLPDQGIGIIKP